MQKSEKNEMESKMSEDITESIALQSKAKRRIPGISQLLSKRPDQFSWGVWPGYFSHASGDEIWDLDGNRYIDMSIGGIGATVLGYADPDVDSAVKCAIDQGVASSLNCPEEVELADFLCELHPWAEMARFARSGGEAMAIAVRIARAHSQKDVIAFCGYHGWHDWYLAANLSDNAALDGHLLPGLEPRGVPRSLYGTSFPFHYNNLDELQDIVSRQGKDLGVIVLEAIRNDAPTKDFISGVQDIAVDCGAVLIIDEISSGFRLCTGGAHMIYDIHPDIAVFSKALGNGYASAAIIGTEEVMQSAQSTFISSTNWTERIGPVAALATIKKFQRVNASQHLVRVGTMVQNGWKNAAEQSDLSIDIGGIPPLSHFSFQDPEAQAMKAYFIQRMVDEGILASTSFYSMYAHSLEHIEAYLEHVTTCFEEIQGLCTKGTLTDELRGSPAGTGFSRLT